MDGSAYFRIHFASASPLRIFFFRFGIHRSKAAATVSARRSSRGRQVPSATSRTRRRRKATASSSTVPATSSTCRPSGSR